MSVIVKSTGAALAVAAASLFGCAAYTSADKSTSVADNVQCYGVNKCKGHNDCKTANNACKGHASCKGQGFISMSATACDHIGGKVSY